MLTTPGLVERRPFARAAVWIFLAFSVLYVGITRGHFIVTDEIAVYQATRSLWEEGNLSTGWMNNTFPGRDGRYYAVYSPGLSVASLPLYGLGKYLGRALARAGRQDWIAIFAGPSIGWEPTRWGGNIEIFFVNLLNCFTTALLCAVFFAFSLRLGVSPRWSLVSTAFLGLTSYVAPFSTRFLQHSSEALFLLWAFYFLFSNARHPDWRSRAWAGVMVALMLLFRFPSVVALPGLALYLLWSVWQCRPADRKVRSYFPEALKQVVPFVVPVVAGIALHLAVNYLKFGTVSLAGGYGQNRFTTPLLKGHYGFLLSSGDSIFLFTPLLLLLPWTVRHFSRRYRTEALLLAFLGTSYLVFYGTFEHWHGLWSALGLRYLVPIVPLLLLPLGGRMEQGGRKAWLALAPLAAIGF